MTISVDHKQITRDTEKHQKIIERNMLTSINLDMAETKQCELHPIMVAIRNIRISYYCMLDLTRVWILKDWKIDKMKQSNHWRMGPRLKGCLSGAFSIIFYLMVLAEQLFKHNNYSGNVVLNIHTPSG